MSKLVRRVAFVTGGESGIGRATALRLAKEGAKVFVADFRQQESNRRLFQEYGIESLPCDVRQESEVQQCFKIIDEFGQRLHILINNAGVDQSKLLPDITEEEWDRAFDTNLKAAFFTCKYAIPRMQQAGGGAIVNTSSNAGILPRSHDPVYSTSKGALLAFTKSLALCHSIDGIRVNAVCPGPVEQTGLMEDNFAQVENREEAAKRIIAASPLARAFQRMITPEEVAEAILYLVSNEAKMVTGTVLAIDGGKSLGVPPGWRPPEPL
ncbi:2-hydroxycyclohexanecarboxyl-CoA dehydrogenase [Planctomycetales bacterium 10988]|nr:2-hydroxycyclohexanecarboxyl-CoA dehydrogenase [Planctomycetales bacterium 10988]